MANIPTPIVHEDYVFTSTGYGAGSALLRLEPTPTGVKVNEVYFHPGNKMQNHHGGMVLVDGHVYLGHGHNQGLPMCVELLTGKAKWGPVRGPGADSAAVLYADGHLYFRYQNAVMALIEATPEAYRLKASFELPSHLDDSWPHPVIADGRLVPARPGRADVLRPASKAVSLAVAPDVTRRDRSRLWDRSRLTSMSWPKTFPHRSLGQVRLD